MSAGATAATATEDGRTTLVVERVSAFEHLHRKHREACPAKDYFDRHQGAWSLTENHGSYASVAFMQGSLSLNMVVGHRLQSEEIRTSTKNLLVQHFNIQSLELKSKVSSSTGMATNPFCRPLKCGDPSQTLGKFLSFLAGNKAYEGMGRLLGKSY